MLVDELMRLWSTLDGYVVGATGVRLSIQSSRAYRGDGKTGKI